ncbi:DedA family protein [Sphingobacterium paludis]|uniref:Membrane-associated protein n=1 Tax=Sphingobacterium paludis TaxID=1476465 RepID=A0A4R7D2A3_9SPHI|nr:DedA family protein [Sphingobacterium paludis]TDS14900.1 membrane-associated protein [Sphingobacterium paludis]
MEIISSVIDFILHIDDHLAALITEYHYWIYLILFLIIFVETGLVIMPFLPGDSLLFATGMFAAQGMLDIYTSIGLMLVAAVLGDACNYLIGKYAGDKFVKLRLFGKQLVKPEYIVKTHGFYAKHGPQTIIIARFVPIVRTFAPFVAGVGKMNYGIFLTYNLIGGVLWVVGLTLAGYFLGNIAWVRDNFEKVVIGIILISVLPILFGFIKEKFSTKKEAL